LYRRTSREKKTTGLVWAQVDRVSSKWGQIKPSLFGQIKAARTTFYSESARRTLTNGECDAIVYLLLKNNERELTKDETLALRELWTKGQLKRVETIRPANRSKAMGLSKPKAKAQVKPQSLPRGKARRRARAEARAEARA
jgi:hypothetical protein